LQSGNIAPVDLPQASIGPGIAVFSKYKEVLEADGNPMSVRQALILINQELDAYLHAQESGLDVDSRFCISWFEQFGFAKRPHGHGDADNMARAMMAHLQRLSASGIFYDEHGDSQLISFESLNLEEWKPEKDAVIWSMVQHLCKATKLSNGFEQAGRYLAILSRANSEHPENIKALSYRAYIIAERKGWTEEALAYNNLVIAWPSITNAMINAKKHDPIQGSLYSEEK
jgi:putative DNA methylase